MLPSSTAEKGMVQRDQLRMGGSDGGVERARHQQQRMTTNLHHQRQLGAGRMQEGSCLPALGF